MVTYSLNWMGPVSLSWFRDRGLLTEVEHVVETEFLANLTGMPVGTTYLREEVTDYWYGGRIDIYGLPEEDYYCGTYEYGLPVMHYSSWNLLNKWLEDFKSESLISYSKLINTFEKDTKHKIRWEKDENRSNT